MMGKKDVLLAAFLVLCGNVVKSQYIEDKKVPVNNLAVPFLLLSTDAVSSGMGETGSAFISDVGNIESGISKVSFLDQRFGANISYTPWLRKLVNDRKLMYAGGFYKVSDKLSLTASINYLSYGKIDAVDENNTGQGSIMPSEFVVGIGASRRFGPNFSMGLKAKLINSKMYNGSSQNLTMQSATGYGMDISFVHLFSLRKLPESSSFTVALNILNIGPKLAYFEITEQKYYLPTSLKIGTALNITDPAQNTFVIALDISKLLVPATGVTTEKSVVQGIVASFSGDATFQDIGYSIGTAYTFKRKLSFRLGYNLNDNKRLMGSFFSVGTGFIHKNTSFNISYIMGNQQKTFLSDTMRVSLALAVF